VIPEMPVSSSSDIALVANVISSTLFINAIILGVTWQSSHNLLSLRR
jgi:hypothetical protein